jgi:hypothetical protein
MREKRLILPIAYFMAQSNALMLIEAPSHSDIEMEIRREG